MMLKIKIWKLLKKHQINIGKRIPKVIPDANIHLYVRFPWTIMKLDNKEYFIIKTIPFIQDYAPLTKVKIDIGENYYNEKNCEKIERNLNRLFKTT